MRISAAIKILPAFFLVFLLVSCQKEIKFDGSLGPAFPGGNGGNGGNGSGSTASIIGDYDYVGSTAHTLSTVTVSTGGQTLKSVTTSDYNTINNTGTLKITSNQFLATNVGDDVDTTMNVKTYMDGALIDDEDLPFSASAPPTSSTSTYVKNSADSITITGSFLNSPSPSGPQPSGPFGAKISWHGDTLYLNMKVSVSQTITQGGVPANMVGTVNAVSKWKKH